MTNKTRMQVVVRVELEGSEIFTVEEDGAASKSALNADGIERTEESG